MAEGGVMVEVWRGDFAESCHAGHAVVCDAAGDVVYAWGDPGAVGLPRSSIKILQALPLVESGAADSLGSEQLALACASHQAAPMHVTRIEAWLADLGLGDDALRCGAALPLDRATRTAMICADVAPGQVHHQCSGKHVGFLTLAAHLRAGPDYVAVDHPVQRAVRAAIEEMSGAETPGWAVDGCSAPNFAMSLEGVARAMARLADPSGLGRARATAAQRLVAAMMAHPLLVAGEGRPCSELMAAMQGRAAIKFGAEGLYTAILPERGLGVALKVSDGALRGCECAIASLLVRLGVLDPAHPAAMRRLAGPIVNAAGIVTGSVRPAPGFHAGAAPI